MTTKVCIYTVSRVDHELQHLSYCSHILYQKTLVSQRLWTPEEDKRLLEMVEAGGKKWRNIGDELNRLGISVRDRFRELETRTDQRDLGRWRHGGVSKIGRCCHGIYADTKGTRLSYQHNFDIKYQYKYEKVFDSPPFSTAPISIHDSLLRNADNCVPTPRRYHLDNDNEILVRF